MFYLRLIELMELEEGDSCYNQLTLWLWYDSSVSTKRVLEYLEFG